jgi:hypothetical protein
MYGGKIRFPKKADEALKDALKGFDRQALHSKKHTSKKNFICLVANYRRANITR